MKTDYALYILMRNDLVSMSPGRCMAQSSHASNAFIHKYGKHKDVKLWQKQTKQGFGTAIVLSVDFLQLTSTVRYLNRVRYRTELVYDPEYSYVVPEELYPLINPEHHVIPAIPKFENGDMLCFRNELTCGYAFGDRNVEEFKSNFSTYPLY